jgi:hypothetical protein
MISLIFAPVDLSKSAEPSVFPPTELACAPRKVRSSRSRRHRNSRSGSPDSRLPLPVLRRWRLRDHPPRSQPHCPEWSRGCTWYRPEPYLRTRLLLTTLEGDSTGHELPHSLTIRPCSSGHKTPRTIRHFLAPVELLQRRLHQHRCRATSSCLCILRLRKHAPDIHQPPSSTSSSDRHTRHPADSYCMYGCLLSPSRVTF